MQTEILYSPAFAMARVVLSPGESVAAESGAMVAMSPGVQIETSVRGGLMSGLKRSVLGGESFFMNNFTAVQGGDIMFAPTMSGDVVEWGLNNETVYLHSGAYLASAGSVTVDTSWGGSKGFFSGAGLILLKISSAGPLLVSSYGALHMIELQAGQSYTVDTGHIVGFSETVQYVVRKAGNWKSTILGGEGLVVDVSGPGRVYMQTRNPEQFLNWIIPHLPTKG